MTCAPLKSTYWADITVLITTMSFTTFTPVFYMEVSK